MTRQLFDLVIVGTGPAGIQAAIHAARRKVDVLVLGRMENSALYSAHVENYAFVGGITTGNDMLRLGVEQARGFGACFLEEDLLHLGQEDGGLFHLTLESGREIRAHAIILCMGVAKKKLGVAGEKEFLGRGVSYCVDCDANFFRGAVVCVTGDRSAAVDGALTLQHIAAKVYLIARELDVSEALKERLAKSAVERLDSRVVKIHGGARGVEAIELENGRRVEVEGLFIELGSKGALQLATMIGVQLDSESMQFIACNRRQQTNVAGVFAAGDITGPPYQMAKAVGEGCVAGMEAAIYAKAVRGREDGT